MQTEYRVLHSQTQEPWRHDIDCRVKTCMHWRRQGEVKTSAHSHQVAQVEIVLCGPIVCNLAEPIVLETGSAVCLPAGVTHSFSYPAAESEWVTTKFHLAPAEILPSPVVLTPGSAGVQLFLQLADLVRIGLESRYPVEPMLNAQMSFIVQELSHESGYFSGKIHWDVVDETLAYIHLRQGKALTVDEIACHLGLSTNYVSRSFRKRKKIGLKAFIDACRVRVARDMIEHSNQTLGDIAQLLDFSDVFAFSRFMKRHLGFPPSELRKNANGDP